MSEHALLALLWRINMKAQVISARGSPAMARVFEMVFDEKTALTASKIGEASLSSRAEDGDRLFEFSPETGIARIPIKGVLVHQLGMVDPWWGMTGYDGIKLKLSNARDDPAVKGILLDIDSPGGEVYGVESAAEAILAARQVKPVVALINEQATSAAYWLASAANSIGGPVSADTGSIGAVVMHIDLSRALSKEGVTVSLIHAGAHKVDGHPFEPLPEDVRADIQTDVDNVRARFATFVAESRGLPESVVLGTEARVLSASDAKQVDLIDDIGSEDEIIEEFAVRLARPESVALLPTG